MMKQILIALLLLSTIVISGCAEDSDPSRFTWSDLGRTIAMQGGVDSTGTEQGGADPMLMGIVVIIGVAWVLMISRAGLGMALLVFFVLLFFYWRENGGDEPWTLIVIIFVIAALGLAVFVSKVLTK